MIRLARRATLLVAPSLLTSAATAYAECAWVVWGHSVSSSGSSRPAGASSDTLGTSPYSWPRAT
jgi:hypothetical protein